MSMDGDRFTGAMVAVGTGAVSVTGTEVGSVAQDATRATAKPRPPNASVRVLISLRDYSPSLGTAGGTRLGSHVERYLPDEEALQMDAFHAMCLKEGVHGRHRMEENAEWIPTQCLHEVDQANSETPIPGITRIRQRERVPCASGCRPEQSL